MKKRALITGITGMDGSHLADFLLAMGKKAKEEPQPEPTSVEPAPAEPTSTEPPPVAESIREGKLNESETATIGEFVKYAIKNLEIQKPPRNLTFSYDNEAAKEKRSFGYFDPNANKIWVYCGNRNMADILRTLAHELVHRKQDEDGRISYESGKTGSDIENEANAKAGVLLRDFGKQHEEIYQ